MHKQMETKKENPPITSLYIQRFQVEEMNVTHRTTPKLSYFNTQFRLLQKTHFYFVILQLFINENEELTGTGKIYADYYDL